MSVLNYKLAKEGITQNGENHIRIDLNFPKSKVKKTTKPVTLLAVIDRSGSMDEAAVSGNPIPKADYLGGSARSGTTMQQNNLNTNINIAINQPMGGGTGRAPFGGHLLPGGGINYQAVNYSSLHSSSISKLAYAKRALDSLADTMGPEDNFGIVAFDHNASVVSEPMYMNDVNKSKIKAAISQIQTGGSTNIEAGLNRAAAFITKEMLENTVVKIILLSDGEANYGAQGPQALGKVAENLSRSGVIITSIGFGISYQAEVMGAIAANGNGNLYHLDDAEKMNDIFQKEFKEAAQVVAKDIIITIDIPELVEIKENLNGFRQEVTSDKIKIHLGSAFADKSLIIPIKNVMADEIAFKVSVAFGTEDGKKQSAKTIKIPVVEEHTFKDLPEDTQVVSEVVRLVEEKAMMDVAGAYDSRDSRGVSCSISAFNDSRVTLNAMYFSAQSVESDIVETLSNYQNGSVSVGENKANYARSYTSRRG